MQTLISAEALAFTTPTRYGSSVDALVDQSERYALDVCQSLRSGVLEASEHVLRALVARPHAQPVTDVFEQALTIVYRMLFLFFAEGRSLVPSWHPIYRSSYSLERLSEQALGRTPVGLWDGLRAVARLAHAGCRAGDLRVTPFNGRLFAPSKTPLAERRDLDDDAARQSLIALSTRPAADGEGRARIAYRDLGVEQLGAVYETLLDYVPQVERVRSPGTHHTHAIVSLHAGSGVRKATGTFYTPQPIAAYLIRASSSTARSRCDARRDSQSEGARPVDGQWRISRRSMRISRRRLRSGARHTRTLPPQRSWSTRAGGNPSIDRRTLLVRRGPQPHGSPTRKVVAVACYAGR